MPFHAAECMTAVVLMPPILECQFNIYMPCVSICDILVYVYVYMYTLVGIHLGESEH